MVGAGETKEHKENNNNVKIIKATTAMSHTKLLFKNIITILIIIIILYDKRKQLKAV